MSRFREALDGHGRWQEDPQYGTIWVPDPSEVGAAFVPYSTAGHWTYDVKDAAYAWISTYRWGWVAFHYGSWCRRSDGWAWVPGRTYAPAWVEWRVEPDAIGWAPRSPTIAWRHGVAEPIARSSVRRSHFTWVTPSHLYASAKLAGDEESLTLARTYARETQVGTTAAPSGGRPGGGDRPNASGKTSSGHGHQGGGHGGSHGKR